MAIVHDVIPPFSLFQPASIDDALELLADRGEEPSILAGGLDSMDWLKDRTKRTSAVIELSQITELQGIRDAAGGVEIGAMTSLTDVAEHPLVGERFPALVRAGGRPRRLTADPQPGHARRQPVAGRRDVPTTAAAGAATAPGGTSATPTRPRR